jgi:secreted trypsin-like serine protease
MKFLHYRHDFYYALSAVSTSHVARRVLGTHDMDCSVIESTVNRAYQFRISYMHAYRDGELSASRYIFSSASHTHCAFPQLTMVQPVELSAIGIAPLRVACNMSHRDVLAGCLEFSSPTSGTSDIGLHIEETTSLALVYALWCLRLRLLV